MKKIAPIFLFLLIISCKKVNKKKEIFEITKKKSSSGLSIHEKDTITLKPLVILYGKLNDTLTKEYKGSGIRIIEPTNDKIIWEYFDTSDFPPHTFSFIDFDGDNNKDLFMYSGFEDVFSTSLFINQINKKTKSTFNEIYTNHLSYCSIIDIDKDGYPEIINTLSKFENEDVSMFFEIDDITQKNIEIEYDRIIGDFNEYNEDYNMPNVYKIFAINLLDKVNILKIKNDKIIDVTDNFPAHKKFRFNNLNSLKNIPIELKSWVNELKKMYE